MKKKETLTIVLVVLILLAGVVVMKMNLLEKPSMSPVPPTQEVAVSQKPSQKVVVTGEGKKLSPSNFTISHLDSLELEITALDNDYSFKLKNYPRMDTIIAKGTTKSVTIDRLGVGEYEYTCGSGCSGKITVTQSSDDQD